MKKVIFILILLAFNFAFAGDEMPIIPMNSRFTIEYAKNNNELIDIGNMKKKNEVENAKNQALQNQPAKIIFDKKQITEQRAIDYINQQNNSLLPSF